MGLGMAVRRLFQGVVAFLAGAAGKFLPRSQHRDRTSRHYPQRLRRGVRFALPPCRSAYGRDKRCRLLGPHHVDRRPMTVARKCHERQTSTVFECKKGAAETATPWITKDLWKISPERLWPLLLRNLLFLSRCLRQPAYGRSQRSLRRCLLLPAGRSCRCRAQTAGSPG